MGFEILCMFYSEFNTEKGAEIIQQYPKDYIKQEDFLKISEFVIPRTELCDNLVIMKLGNAYLMGFPIHLKNSNYDRAKFQFNFCILISDKEYEKNSLIYELLIKKVAKTFEGLEIDSEYEFIASNRNLIFNFLEKLYESMILKEDIISIQITSVEETGKNIFFFFKFIDFSKAKTEILAYQVPVWLKYIDEKDLMYFECSVRKIIEQIDGISSVKKISSKLDYEFNYVIYILFNLTISECITMVDIFQFSNIYRASSNLKKFYNQPLLNEFNNFANINLKLFNNQIKYKNILKVYLDEKDSENETSLEEGLNDGVLFSLFCELTNSVDVSEFIFKVKNYKINILLFVAFGVYKKIIRRVHIYAYCKSKENKDNFDEQESNDLFNIFLGLLDGRHCLDEICCETNKSTKEVLNLISNMKDSTIFYK